MYVYIYEGGTVRVVAPRKKGAVRGDAERGVRPARYPHDGFVDEGGDERGGGHVSTPPLQPDLAISCAENDESLLNV